MDTQGWFTAAEVKRAAYGCFIAAFLLGIYLVAVGGWPIVAIGLLSLLSGWAYTGGPKPLAYSALGEIFVWLFFGLAAVMGSYYLQAGTVSWSAFLAAAALGALAAAVLVVNNYRDFDSDRRAGKQTLAVRIGRAGTRIEYAALVLAAFALLPLLAWRLGSDWALLPLLLLPWVVALLRRFYREPPGPVFNQILAETAKLQAVFGVVICVGLLV